MTLGILESIRNGWLNDIRDAIDDAVTAGKIQLYTGSRPATGASITTQTLLGTINFADPSAPNASGGILTFDADPDLEDSDAAANGTAVWARILDGDNTFVLDCDIGLSISQEGTLTSGSPTITGFSDTSKMSAGMLVSGTGIPAGATVVSVDSATQITISANATASGSNTLLVKDDADILLNDTLISQGGIIRITAGTLTAGNA